MPSFNKCIFIGHMTRDPQLKHLASETQLVEFGIACNHKFTSNGEKREEVMFLDCSAFGKTAEIIVKYFTKGKPILVEGRLKLDQWDDKQSGAKRSKHSLVVDRFTFVGGNKDDGEQHEQRSSAPSSSPSMAQQMKATARAKAPAGPEFDEQGIPAEDIPF